MGRFGNIKQLTLYGSIFFSIILIAPLVTSSAPTKKEHYSTDKADTASTSNAGSKMVKAIAPRIKRHSTHGLSVNLITNNGTIEFHNENEFTPFAQNEYLMQKLGDSGIKREKRAVKEEWESREFIPTYDTNEQLFDIGPALKENSNTETSRVKKRITKVYRYKILGTDRAPTFRSFTTEINSNLIEIKDERKYNNFRLKDWYTTDGTEKQPDETNADTEENTYESLKETRNIYNAGSDEGKIELTSNETELILLYEYEPIQEQINLIMLQYTGAGTRVTEQRIEFPQSGTLDFEDIPGKVIGARYSEDEVPAFIENWNGTEGMNGLQIAENGEIQLVPQAQTVYLNVIASDLIGKY